MIPEDDDNDKPETHALTVTHGKVGVFDATILRQLCNLIAEKAHGNNQSGKVNKAAPRTTYSSTKIGSDSAVQIGSIRSAPLSTKNVDAEQLKKLEQKLEPMMNLLRLEWNEGEEKEIEEPDLLQFTINAETSLKQMKNLTNLLNISDIDQAAVTKKLNKRLHRIPKKMEVSKALIAALR